MPDTELVIPEPSRSEVVRVQILQLGRSIHGSFVTLGRLLKEARDGGYNLQWGEPRFGRWIETSSGLDMSERTAYDLIKVIEVAERLEIPDNVLEAVKISCLKEIAALPAETDPAQVRALIAEAKDMTIKEVKEATGQIKGETFVYHTIKNSQDVEDNVYQPALERIRREYGNTMGPDGEPEDISDSKAIEMVLADKLAEPEMDEDVIEGEFHDVVEYSPEAA